MTWIWDVLLICIAVRCAWTNRALRTEHREFERASSQLHHDRRIFDETSQYHYQRIVDSLHSDGYEIEYKDNYPVVKRKK
jgi:hypothetical protein